jgi:hypothetical protein
MKLTGRVTLMQVRNGRIVHIQQGENLVVNAGRVLIRNVVKTAAPATKPTHIGAGTSGTAVAAGDTALGTESGITREALTEDTTGTYSIAYSTAAGIDNNSGGDVVTREFGLFNAVAAGTMLARFLCQEFTWEDTDTVHVTWELTFGD